MVGEITFIAEPQDVNVSRDSQVELKCQAEGMYNAVLVLVMFVMLHTTPNLHVYPHWTSQTICLARVGIICMTFGMASPVRPKAHGWLELSLVPSM